MSNITIDEIVRADEATVAELEKFVNQTLLKLPEGVRSENTRMFVNNIINLACVRVLLLLKNSKGQG